MTTIVSAAVPAEQFALRDTLESVPGAEFELLQLVADRESRVMPFVWATADEPDRLPEAVHDDPTTDEAEVLADVGGEYLFRFDWSAATRLPLRVIVEGDGTVISGTGRGDRWRFRLLFPDRSAVSATYERCSSYGLELDFERISGLTESFRQGGFGLTDSQYETIALAYDGGYYAVPRRKTLKELAEELGVSHQSLSERLRRGHGTLIENGLHPSPELAG